MPHYKALDNSLHFIDSDRFEHMLPPGCVQITDTEAEAIVKKAKDDADKLPKPPRVTLVDQILADPAELAKLKAALAA